MKDKKASQKTESKSDDYDAKSITSLEGLEAVRMRPAMYIGSTSSRGFHHLVYEVVDNSIDEALVGHCSEINVRIIEDDLIEITDNGRGIPVDNHPKYNVPALQVVMTKLHAGGKFDKKSYKVSGGLHGVGVSCVNALSEFLTVQVMRDRKIYMQKYERGKPITELEIIGDTDKRGTIVLFKPDPTIFEVKKFEYDILASRLRELAFLNKGVRITLTDERVEKKQEFFYEGGIKSFIEFINKNKAPLHDIIYFEKYNGDIMVEVAMQYNNTFNDNIFSYVNNINTIEGGTHLSGFKTALTRCLNNYAEKHAKEDIKLSSDDVREGLSSVISIKIPNPQFEGQTKTKLGNHEVKGAVDRIVNEKLNEFLEEHPQDARMILEKAITAARARDAAKKARDLTRRKGLLGSGSLPGKLADCSSKDASKSEIFIVEGDSAGGCFAADTKVALADGRNLSFKDLVNEHRKGKKNYCYTVNKDGSVGISLIKNPRKTKSNSEVIKIILDNDEEITCTPDHLFMLRDASYIEACKLRPEQSLMPLNRKLSKIGGRITIEDYEMVLCPKRHRWIFTHLLSDKFNLDNGIYKLSDGDYRHHIDFNKKNNNPNNIIRLSREEHMQLHAVMAKKTLLRKDVIEKCKRLRKTPEFRKKISEIMSTPKMKKILSERAKKQWENEDYKKHMREKFLEFYNSNHDYRINSQCILDKAQKHYWSNIENRSQQAKRLRKFFNMNPDLKLELSQKAKKQWKNTSLRKWRSRKTKEQWTEKFRQNRKRNYNLTYFKHTIQFMKEIYDRDGDLRNYDSVRIDSRNPNLLRKDTFCRRFFMGNECLMKYAVAGYNHKIKKIIKLNRRIDVYDLEVEGTHNFALASGVFVHNSAKQGRDRNYQAILPLKGKILNVEKARLSKVLNNNEITVLISALGCGIGDEFDISKLRYHKIIIMTDADVDGAHIKTLLLTLFYRYMKPLIENGHVYVAVPPLYRIKKGKFDQYVYNESEKEKILADLGLQDIYIQRYKGLGEMNPQQLWDTTMDMEKRKLVKINIEDAVAADEIFTILMGDQVEPRRKFIEDHATEVTDLDV